MKIRGLLLGFVALAALAGTLYWSNHHNNSDAVQASADAPPKILALNEAAIVQVDLSKKDGSPVELIANRQEIEFGRSQDSWQILKPRPLRADSSKVNDLVSKLTDAKMDFSGAPDERELARLFASGKPVSSVKLTDAAGTQELQVHKNKDDYYVKSSAVPGVYKVASDIGQALDK